MREGREVEIVSNTTKKSSSSPPPALPQCPKTPHKKRYNRTLATSPERRDRSGGREMEVAPDFGNIPTPTLPQCPKTPHKKRYGSSPVKGVRGGVTGSLLKDGGSIRGEVTEALESLAGGTREHVKEYLTPRRKAKDTIQNGESGSSNNEHMNGEVLPQCPKTPHKKRLGGSQSVQSSPSRRKAQL